MDSFIRNGTIIISLFAVTLECCPPTTALKVWSNRVCLNKSSVIKEESQDLGINATLISEVNSDVTARG